MRFSEFTENVIQFPTHLAKRKQLMKRLADKSSNYNDTEGFLDDFIDNSLYPPKPGSKEPEFLVVDLEGKAHATFTSYAEAEKAIPRLSMKSGKRGLMVADV